MALGRAASAAALRSAQADAQRVQNSNETKERAIDRLMRCRGTAIRFDGGEMTLLSF